MSANKYGNTLTVILVIIVIAVIVGAGVLLYTYVIKPHNKEKEAAQAIIEFDKTIEEDNNNQQDNNNEEINLDDFANTIIVTEEAYYLSVYFNSDNIKINDKVIDVDSPYCVFKVDKFNNIGNCLYTICTNV